MPITGIRSCALSELSWYPAHAHVQLLDDTRQKGRAIPGGDAQPDCLILHFDPEPADYALMDPVEQSFYHPLTNIQIEQLHRFVFRLAMDSPRRGLAVACLFGLTRSPTVAQHLAERFHLPLENTVKRLDIDLLHRLRTGGSPAQQADTPQP